MTEQPGWTTHDRRVVIGRGPAQFVDAGERLLGWRIHEAAGLRVLDAAPRVSPGASARLRTRVFVVPVVAPVRVWSVIEEPQRVGFTYTSLPGHPVEGVEEFLIELGEDGEVSFSIKARARPALWWSRLLPGITEWVEARTIDRMLRAAGPDVRGRPAAG